MRQRVGLARALAADTDIILMDEAFSALDPLIRAEMQDPITGAAKDPAQNHRVITHDLDEAVGTPREILHSPADEYVDRFASGGPRWSDFDLVVSRLALSQRCDDSTSQLPQVIGSHSSAVGAGLAREEAGKAAQELKKV
ncbi:glycine betaine/proline betaine transport system ATP-binding protein ProV [Ditylenchus destructor]|nr:glycine betaine/proline betaine transport system ATP-binding protein ProV [Ditylenchus destructor]